jgi:hypothetical protein
MINFYFIQKSRKKDNEKNFLKLKILPFGSFGGRWVGNIGWVIGSLN